MEPHEAETFVNKRTLYAPIEPYSSGNLKVSDVHTLYWEQSGKPDGHPVVFLHGGPGGGTAPSNRRFFDPEFYRIVLFDQRGAGKSTPHACLEENTTWDLVNDIEKLREHLKIPEWLVRDFLPEIWFLMLLRWFKSQNLCFCQVFGGSWGSTLALAYSQSHPDKVTGLVLRGIFLLRKKEIDWFYEGGAAAIYPDAWEEFRDLIPENERGSSLVDAYHKRLNSDDLEIQYAAARAWTKWEMMTAYLRPNLENVQKAEDDKFSLAFARIENHYFVNKGFFPSDSHLLDNVDKIRHIKTTIVQGRYDVCCPMMSAWDLHKAWPEAELKIVYDAGHSANEPGISAELVVANEKMKALMG
jgi:proline iminopeptidase